MRDADVCDRWKEVDGTLLDLAFCDRFKVWDDLRQQHGHQVHRAKTNKRFPGLPQWYFDHDDTRYFAPGRYPKKEKDWNIASQRRTRVSGPDGKGEDGLIKNAEQLTSCVNEVIGQLSSLQAFGWRCSLPLLPEVSFNALRALSSLTSLGYGNMMPSRNIIHAREWPLLHANMTKS